MALLNYLADLFRRNKFIFGIILFFCAVASAQVFFDEIRVDNLKLDQSTISSENTNGNILLDPNGTGNVRFPDLTTNRVPYIDGNGDFVVSSVTDTELGYLSGVTSSIQTQLSDGVGALVIHAADTTSVHGISDTANLVTLAGSDILTNKTINDAITFNEIPTPSNPASGYMKVYCKTDDNCYKLDSSGNEVSLSGGGGGGGTPAITTKTANYTATTSDDIILVDASSGGFTITLFSASGNTGQELWVKKTDSSSNAVVISGGDISLDEKSSYAYLVSDGTDWLTLSPNPSGRDFSLTTTGTSIDVSSIPAWATKVTIYFNEVSTDGTSPMIVQLGDSGGVETSSYISTSLRVVNGGNPNSGDSTSGFVMEVTSAAYQLTGNMELKLIDADNNTWVSTHTGMLNTNNSITGAGRKSLSSVLTSIRLTTSSGTPDFDSGSITVFWE